MARLKIIILETEPGKVNYALWADVPAARQRFYADASKVSVWKDALAADNTALQNGSVVERVFSEDISRGAASAPLRAFLEARAQDFQTKINAHNPWSRYGTTYDTAWVAGGVA